MLPDRVSNPGPLTYESGALPIALRGPALQIVEHYCQKLDILQFKILTLGGFCQSTSKLNVCVNGCMDEMRFYVLFNSISVISGRWTDDNERLKRDRLERGSNPGPLIR